MGNLKKTYGQHGAARRVDAMRDALMDKARKKYCRRMRVLKACYVVAALLYMVALMYALAASSIGYENMWLTLAVIVLALEATPLIVYIFGGRK